MEHLLQGLNGIVVTKIVVKLLDETAKMFVRYINVSYIWFRGSEICGSIWNISWALWVLRLDLVFSFAAANLTSVCVVRILV